MGEIKTTVLGAGSWGTALAKLLADQGYSTRPWARRKVMADAIQAGRELRVITQSREVDDARADLLATDLAAKIQSEMDYPGKIKITVIRETRASATAR